MIGDFLTIEKQIVAAARNYLNVPFRHQGRDRNGLDCLGLLVRVAEDCALCKDGITLSSRDRTDYGHIADGRRLYSGLKKLLQPVEGIVAGSVLSLESDGEARHLAIVGDYPQGGFSIIHAYAPARKVVEHRLDEAWEEKIRFKWCYVEG